MQVTNLNSAIKQITVGGVNYSFTGSSYMGTTAEWNNSNHKPAHGELIIYNDNGKIQFKIGDGTTLAKNLAFVASGGGGGSSVPGRFHKSGLVDEQIEWTSDYSAASISGLVPDCSFVRLGSSVISLTINDMARDLTSDNTYSADAKVCFQVASQASLDANGGKFTLTLPDTFILLNEVEFVPGARYLLEIQGLEYNLDYACRITPIKPWGATTIGNQTFSYNRNENCIEMNPNLEGDA